MATNTVNYNLIKPGVNDPADADRWGNQLNENLDDIDSELYDGQYGMASYAVSSGAAADTYEITLTPAITSYEAGLTIKFKAHQDNVGSATLNINALGAQNIKKDISSDLGASDIKNGQVITVVYDGTNFQMQSRANTAGSVITTQGDIITGGSGGSAQRLGLGLIGQFLQSDGTDVIWDYISKLNYQVFTSDDTFTLPDGVEKVAVACWGAGGGGGGATSGTIAYPTISGAGGAGGFSFGIYSPSSTETVTVGTGGAGGAAGNNNGSAGTDSSFGDFISATGGAGGEGVGTGNGYGFGKGGAVGGTGSSGIINCTGESGRLVISTTHNNTSYDGVYGINDMSTVGGRPTLGLTDYANGGAGAKASNNSVAGSAGQDGLVIVFW